ncbi:MAG: family 16 glycosylhydrolase [Bacteroidales bacterium]
MKRGLLVIWLTSLTLVMWGQNWDLVWSDEFDGDTLDLTRWSFQTGTGTAYGLPDGWGNNEKQYYLKENTVVADGMLTIIAKEEAYGGKSYTSSRIRTLNKGDWTYGRFEFRAKMPSGKGLWAALWMLPTDTEYGGWAASGEIDMVEFVGHELDKVYGTLHFGGQWPNNVQKGKSFRLTTGAFSEGFHDFAMEWEEGEIRWYVDDQLYQVLNQGDWWSSGGSFPAPFDKRFHFLINLAVGGNWPGSPDNTTVFPQELVIDYLRIYEKNTTAIGPESGLPVRGYTLEQNFPNPFRPYTTISYAIPEPEQVLLEVFDAMGRRVQTLVDEVKEPGMHQTELEGDGFPPGIYSYRLMAGPFFRIRQMILL